MKHCCQVALSGPGPGIWLWELLGRWDRQRGWDPAPGSDSERAGSERGAGPQFRTGNPEQPILGWGGGGGRVHEL